MNKKCIVKAQVVNRKKITFARDKKIIVLLSRGIQRFTNWTFSTPPFFPLFLFLYFEWNFALCVQSVAQV